MKNKRNTKNVFKKAIAAILTFSLIFSMTACSAEADNVTSQNSSKQTSSYIPPSSEYPSSEEELSSEESSDLSSIVSEIKSSSSASSKPASSKPASSKPASSKPASSKPASSEPASSEPASSEPASSEPASSEPEQSENTPNQGGNVSHAEMRAVWIAFLEFDSFKGSDEAAFTSRIQTYYDTAIAKGLNTVIVQVRPHGDSMYESQYYPWSKHISGTMGVGVDYDPLAIMVSEAHSRNLEIHAWINPYRTMLDSEFATVDDSYPTKQWYNSSNRWEYMVQGTDGRWWLKPGNSEVQQLIIDGSNEIMRNYAVDGIHIDDYFYNKAPAAYGDSNAQAKANTTAMVKGLYDGVKSINPSARFGVSPAGGFRENNSLPASDIGSLSTDLALWCSQAGYIDYVMPQIYWDYNHSTQPFAMTLSKWESFVTEDSVALYIGLAPYRLSREVIHQQINDIMSSSRASGYVLFRYDHILGL